ARELPRAACIAAEAQTEAAMIDAVERLVGGSSGVRREDGASDRMNAQTTPEQTPRPAPAEAAPAGPGAKSPHRQGPSIALAAIALALALAVIGWLAWKEFIPPPDRTGERIARMEQRITTLEQDVQERLTASGQGRGEAERRDAALAARIGEV